MTPGQQFGRYVIRAKLGAGGMAEVYLADDQQLGRRVALKLLPPATETDPLARRRLVREARAAATLDHPHICAVYEVDEADGRRYIAMQYVDGEALDARLRRSPLELPGDPGDGRSDRRTRWSRRTRTASFIATSSPPTSWSRRAAMPRSWTSASPSTHRGRSGTVASATVSAAEPPAARSSARSPTCRQSRRAAKRSTPRSDLFSVGMRALRDGQRSAAVPGRTALPRSPPPS